MKRILLLFIVLLSVYGCRTGRHISGKERVDNALNSWIGSSKSELVAIHGAPSQTYPTDDGAYILVFFVKKCKIQFFIDRNDKIYNSTWDGCYKSATINNWQKYPSGNYNQQQYQ
jgi:hypothetical protein